MPVPGFLTSIADKAQTAMQGTPLAQHLPAGNRPVSPDGSAQPNANQAASSGGYRSHTFEAIQHQLRTLGQQYSSTTPVQKIITTAKGVALDVDSQSRDSKQYSKELYTWSQTQDDDIRDVSDRLAYLNFVAGSLASTLAVKLDGARSSLKSLRDAETAIGPRRAARSGLETQIARLEHEQPKGAEKRLAELKSQLKKAEQDDTPQEKEVELLKRKAVRESERVKWSAVREYAEKLVLISQAAEPIIDALPTLPPTEQNPYAGSTATAAARASLQRALDNYKTGHINLATGASDLNRSDTRSFGETHAKELSESTSSTARPGIPMTPPTSSGKLPGSPTQQDHPPSSFSTSPVLSAKSPASPTQSPNLNLAPAVIPSAQTEASTTSPVPGQETSPTPGIHPTVAETGVPVSGGPGPASGSLRDLRGASADAGPRSGGAPGNGPATTFGESAEEEKKRLAREERERVLATGSGGGSAPGNTSAATSGESAEEEKKRLAREDRERVLATGGSVPESAEHGGAPEKAGEEDLPPYQDY